MSNKRIKLNLSERSITSALKEVESLKSAQKARLHAAAKEIAEEICERAQANFDSAWYDEVGRGVRDHARINCRVEETRDGYRVVAEGKEVTFIEFGAGVYYNPPAGASLHPKGAELGFLIGGYGKGHGKQHTWGYYADEDKQQLILTHGTAMQQPLYRAFCEVVGERKAKT